MLDIERFTEGRPTEQEGIHIEDVLYRMVLEHMAKGDVSDARQEGYSWVQCCSTPDFVRMLGWPQRRLTTVRDYLETTRGVQERLLARLGEGKRGSNIFVSWKSLSVGILVPA